MRCFLSFVLSVSYFSVAAQINKVDSTFLSKLRISFCGERMTMDCFPQLPGKFTCLQIKGGDNCLSPLTQFEVVSFSAKIRMRNGINYEEKFHSNMFSKLFSDYGGKMKSGDTIFINSVKIRDKQTDKVYTMPHGLCYIP